MNRPTKLLFAASLATLFGIISGHAQVTVYDNLSTTATAGSSRPDSSNPVFGDSLSLTAGGALTTFGFGVFNSSAGGNTGTIYTGDLLVQFYDNTIPYVGGTLANPLIGSATFSIDFTAFGGLPPDFYSTGTVDLSSFGLVLPPEILVTQQFTQTSGDSARNGIILLSDPSIGSSPNTFYRNSSIDTEGLVTITGNPGQVAYTIEVITLAANNPPVANPQSISLQEDTTANITLTGSDADNDPLTYSVVNAPTNGTLSGAPPNLVYTPNLHFIGLDSFTFKANDGQTDSIPAAVSITVTPPPTGIVITPVWDSTILGDPNASAITNTIGAAIRVYESSFNDPINVTIKFAEMGSGLGQSSTFIGTISYSSFVTALNSDSKTTNDVVALANVPGGSINPVDGTSSIRLTTANMRALGFSGNPPPGQPDSTISVNMSIINITRTSIDPSKYDLMAVVSHEIDEALGSGSGLTRPNGAPADLFRYSSGGGRNYTTSGDDAYLSINGGATDLVRYNQNAGGDYGDWWSTGPHTPRVQDAFGTPGATPNLGVELRLLDVIGYDLAPPVPPPTFQTVSRTGSTISFSWSAAAGRSYQVQYVTDLTQTTWNNLGGPIFAASGTANASDSIGPDPKRFYRVALLPTPSASPGPAVIHPAPLVGPLTLDTRYFLPDPHATPEKEAPTSTFERAKARPFPPKVTIQRPQPLAESTQKL